MKAALLATFVAACAAGAALPALADVKAGVDAWQQGDYGRAVASWRPLATAGDADAQFNLGQAYKLGRGVPADLPAAMEWFRKASAQGHARASDNYGLLLFQQGRREDALPYIRKSADRGEPRAQYILATAMFNGDLVPKDWVRAYALMTRSSASGLTQASDSLATMDKFIDVAQRQKGLALAADMARAADKPQQAAVAPAAAEKAGKAAPIRSAGTNPTLPAPAEETATTNAARASEPDAAPRAPYSGGVAAAASEAPTKAARSASVAPVTRTAAKVPSKSLASTAPVPATSGVWRIQMGAFREDARARALWQSASIRSPGLGGYKPMFVKGGDVTRLQTGPLKSQADAARLCGQVRAAGFDCVVKRN